MSAHSQYEGRLQKLSRKRRAEKKSTREEVTSRRRGRINERTIGESGLASRAGQARTRLQARTGTAPANQPKMQLGTLANDSHSISEKPFKRQGFSSQRNFSCEHALPRQTLPSIPLLHPAWGAALSGQCQ
mmetsp:Transcript_73979/g.176070  ORF Transcript_73979/g.176070 Transcript_73979/m.176070 type:complete len:131 (-) Transcript_73979:1158-1550(-)